MSSVKTDRNHNGFTLVEVIVFLVVVSIVGVMIFTYSMSARHAVDPVRTLDVRNRLQSVMETLVMDYKQRLAAGTLTLAGFRDHAGSVAAGGVSVGTEMVRIQAGDPQVLKITVSLEGQSLCALFTQ
jgi:Tfp pilus assembly protein PilE